MQELVILGHALCGDLDGCSIRYALLQASFVNAVPQWVSHNQLSAFITLLYPFLGVRIVVLCVYSDVMSWCTF